MSLGRVLVEEFQAEVLKWLRERVDLVVVNPWVEPDRWDLEVSCVDAVISRKGKITREQMARSKGRLKIIARTGVGVDPSRVDLEAAKELKVWITNQPGSNSVAVTELVFGQMVALVRTPMKPIAPSRKIVGATISNSSAPSWQARPSASSVWVTSAPGWLVAAPSRWISWFTTLMYRIDVTALGGKYVGLDELLADSDFVTIHCPLNGETRHDQRRSFGADETGGLSDQCRARWHRRRSGVVASDAAKKACRCRPRCDRRRAAAKRPSTFQTR